MVNPAAKGRSQVAQDSDLGGQITPLLDVMLRIGSKIWRIGLKLESNNLGGSIKYRTAHGIVTDLERRGKLRPGRLVVESTSGNLGIALALLSHTHGYKFIAVTDPNTDPAVLERLESLGAQVICVTEPDTAGGYLLSRLSTVGRLLAAESDAIWPNQYENPANPAAHYHQTAPEIYRQCPELDAIFVAASTGGTLAGIGRYLRHNAPTVKVIGVDLSGSRVFGLPGGKRLVTGIGSSRPSSFLHRQDYDDVVIVEDEEAISTCHQLREEIGLGLGGSSGAVIAACSRYLAENPWIRRPVCICPDGQSNYMNTLYSPAWLARHGLDAGRHSTEAVFGRVRENFT
jgi:N-(2-amino-2-carboxyethyl)-L-glutamate synthase